MIVRTLKIFLSLLLLIVALLTTSPMARAGGTALTLSGPTTATLGSEFIVRLSLTTDIAVNAGSLVIVYPPDILEVKDLSYGNSIFKLWPQTPNSSPSVGHITFMGGLPTPGFTGNNGTLLEVRFKSIALAKADISILKSGQVLLNDGKGSNTAWTSNIYSVNIIPPTPGETTPPPPTPLDTSPPTNLQLILGRDGNLFNGDWFATFTAEDLGSGIDYYQIAETNPDMQYPDDSLWIKANSPFRLTNQTERTTVFLKAVDKAGNSAVTSAIHAPRALPDYLRILLLTILALIALLSLLNVYTQLKGWKEYYRTLRNKKNLL